MKWVKLPVLTIFLENRANKLTNLITQIFNLSIKLFHFPNKCKLAKLRSLYKKHTKADTKNFRPISHLPTVSKINEKVIRDQTMEYLKNNKVLCR